MKLINVLKNKGVFLISSTILVLIWFVTINLYSSYIINSKEELLDSELKHISLHIANALENKMSLFSSIYSFTTSNSCW